MAFEKKTPKKCSEVLVESIVEGCWKLREGSLSMYSGHVPFFVSLKYAVAYSPVVQLVICGVEVAMNG